MSRQTIRPAEVEEASSINILENTGISTRDAGLIMFGFASLLVSGVLLYSDFKNDLKDIREDKITIIHERLSKIEESLEKLEGGISKDFQSLKDKSLSDRSLLEKDLLLQERRLEDLENYIARLRTQSSRDR